MEIPERFTRMSVMLKLIVESEMRMVDRTATTVGESLASETLLEELARRSLKGQVEEAEQEYGYELPFLYARMPNVVWRGLYLHTYGCFEHSIDSLASTLMAAMGSDLRIGDLKGQGLHRSLVCLQRMYGIELDEKDCNHLKRLNDLRNVLAHADARIPDEKRRRFKALERYVKDAADLAFNNVGEIIIDQPFCGRAALFFHEFFDRASDAAIDVVSLHWRRRGS